MYMNTPGSNICYYTDTHVYSVIIGLYIDTDI